MKEKCMQCHTAYESYRQPYIICISSVVLKFTFMFKPQAGSFPMRFYCSHSQVNLGVYYFFIYFTKPDRHYIEEDCEVIVDLAPRLNSTKLSAFNFVIMSPVSVSQSVLDAFSRKGACLVQRGFVYHKKKIK